jgi:hypothetical protein
MKHPAVDMFVTIVPPQVGLLSYLNLAPPISDTIASIQAISIHSNLFLSLYPLTDAVVRAGYRRSEILFSISGQNQAEGGRFRIGSGFIREGLIGSVNCITYMKEDPKKSKEEYTKFRNGIQIQNKEYEVPNYYNLRFKNVNIHVLTASYYRY